MNTVSIKPLSWGYCVVMHTDGVNTHNRFCPTKVGAWLHALRLRRNPQRFKSVVNPPRIGVWTRNGLVTE